MDDKRSEKKRREAAQAGKYAVGKGGYEVAGRSLDTMISLRLNSAQLHMIHEAAKIRNMTLSQFIRESALKAAALPYVQIIGFPTGATTYMA